ncbi:tonB-system energizer ExbB [Novosphingobium sp. FSY-8]|uniref:Biopolymer transport protein ExbB n=2 Tax=Novosphingobium ovatum TaxID=1908523 RepID=A0ABW9XEQ0_9SPHN|nr:tonB-system energizer ExbB [Novosphingobium ovatum]
MDVCLRCGGAGLCIKKDACLTQINCEQFSLALAGPHRSRIKGPPMRVSFAKLTAATVLALGVASPALAQAAAPVVPAKLSVAEMFLNADWVVKVVMAGLGAASVATWTVFGAKRRELARAAAQYTALRDTLAQARGLETVRGHAELASPLLDAALTELRLSSDALHDTDGVKERIATRFSRIEAETARNLTKGVNLLATIGATAPFVGLFGTVWGIMNAFVGIAEKQTTNLAVVAPGIAEALLATAVGLIAAIPAVVIYNHFSRKVAHVRALLGDVAANVMNLVSRDLSRGAAGNAARLVQVAE